MHDLIDFHAHVLPGADHGCRNVDCSLRQLELLSGAGINKVVATPHFYPHKKTLSDFLLLRDKCILDMKAALKETSPKIYPAAEVFLVRNLDRMDGLEKLCIAGTKTLLVELPLRDFDDELAATLINIRENGLYPVIAHIDRYENSTRERLAEMGIPCQINVESLCSFFKKRSIMPYILNGSVWAIGTDIHGENAEFIKSYKKACSTLDTKLEKIMKLSSRLLEGAEPII